MRDLRCYAMRSISCLHHPRATTPGDRATYSQVVLCRRRVVSSHLSVPSERRPFEHSESHRVDPGRSCGEVRCFPSRSVTLESWFKAGDDERVTQTGAATAWSRKSRGGVSLGPGFGLTERFYIQIY
jgi:hypothetical protein